jgi:branched-chain amino acid transport system ATP-binding protein
MSAALQVDNLVKRYGGLTVTDKLSLNVLPGELHAVIGPNGAGKTTLIGQLSGELRPDAGRVLLNGRDITRMPVEKRVRHGLARSYQITSVFKPFTALENVVMAVQARRGHSFRFWTPVLSTAALTEPAHDALALAGLSARAHTPAGELAHGELRQLELAMVLACQPSLLLLDEPMAGMSQHESEAMTRLLLQLRGHYTILLVEHDMKAVFALSDRITVLVYGSALACGTADEIRNNAQVRECYLGSERGSGGARASARARVNANAKATHPQETAA